MSSGTAVRIGSVELAAPVMTASGTAGHGTELARYMDLSQLGAVVVKSLAAFEWAGNPSPRLHSAGVGMINAVGLQGPGVRHWLNDELPALVAAGATVVASIWGRTVEEYRQAAQMLADAPAAVSAVEVNLSCPNLGHGGGIDRSAASATMFAYDAELSAEVIAATVDCGRPRWAKLSPNTDRLVAVAAAVQQAGAEAITLINTLRGMVLAPSTGLPVLAGPASGDGGGGYSGIPVHAIAVRAVFDCYAALPGLPIVGVGGIATGWDAAEMMLAGAAAVQVGTATFADPRAPLLVQKQLTEWCAKRKVAVSDLTGGAHRSGLPS